MLTVFYTLSLHDALPILKERFGDQLHLEAEPADELGRRGILGGLAAQRLDAADALEQFAAPEHRLALDRKSTRLNSSHVENSYAVFCLKININRMQIFVH